MKLGEKIKALREKAGLTQEALAEKIEVQRNTVWRWENRKANLNAENIQRLSSVLKVDASELIDDEDATPTMMVTSNLSDVRIPTKVILSTEPSPETAGRLVARDGDFYINLPDTAEGYAAFIHILDNRNTLSASGVVGIASASEPVVSIG